VREVGGGVQARLGGGMVDGSVSEAADDDGVLGPGGLDAERSRTLDRERDPDGAGDVGGDRRRHRDDGQRVVAEHLVAAARDRVLLGGGDAAEDVGHPVPSRLRGPREVEGAGAIVEERRIGRPQCERDAGVRLVPRRADGVEAPPDALQGARREVAEAAPHLRPPDRLRVRRFAAPAGRQRAQAVEQVRLEGIELHREAQPDSPAVHGGP
jgi:hypothetical protein